MSDEKVRVLKMLEDGVIKYEEALQLLRALSAAPAATPAPEPEVEVEADEAEEVDVEQINAEVQRDVQEALQDVATDVGEAVNEAMSGVQEAMQGVSAEVGEAVNEAMKEVQKALAEIDFSKFEWGRMFGLGDWGGPRHQVTQREDIELTADIKTLRLAVQTKNGNINLLPAEGNRVGVTINSRVHAANEEEAQQLVERHVHLEQSRDGDALVISLTVDAELRGVVSGEFTLPADLPLAVELHSRNGRVSLDGLQASGTVDSRNGSLRLHDVQAKDMIVSTRNGSITFEGGSAERLELDSRNGSIRLDADVAELKAGTTNGAVRCKLRQARSGKIALATRNGSVRLELPQESDVGYQVEALSSRGSIRVDLPDFVAETKERRQVKGATAGYADAAKKAEIRAESGNGSITIIR